MLSLALASCGDASQHYELSGAAMGTQYSIKAARLPARSDTLAHDIAELLESIENELSTYRPESTISRFNDNPATGWQTVTAEFCAAVARSVALGRATGGAFDVTVAPLVDLWGFGPGSAVTEPPSAERIAEQLRYVGYTQLETDCTVPAVRKAAAELRLDLSAWAKGYAVDRLAELIESQGIESYIVELGGELRARGRKNNGDAWIVGIEAPEIGARRVQTRIAIDGLAVATSGDYRNYFEHNGRRYSHTIDPRSGWPVEHELASVTVVHSSAATADAMATAIHVLGPTDGYAFAQAEGLAVLLLLRTDSGIQARATDSFAALGVAS